MISHLKSLVACLLPSLLTLTAQAQQQPWHLYVEQPGTAPLLVDSFALPDGADLTIKKSLEGFELDASLGKTAGYWTFTAKIRSQQPGRECYLSLVRSYAEDSVPVTFNGPVAQSAIYRQSPHEPLDHGFHTLVVQPVPLIALKTPEGLEIAISNTPALYDNYTTQTYDLAKRSLALSSGDNALVWNGTAFEPNPDKSDRTALFRIEPHYFALAAGKEHRLEAIIVKAPADQVTNIRQLVNLAVSRHWSQGRITDLLGATFFSTAYMNLRVNETGRSRFWVVPSIDYANKQYSRDSFWISMVLPPEYSKSCFEHESRYDSKFIGAERQLFALIWAYRNSLSGATVDKQRVERILRIVEAQAPNGYFSGFNPDVKSQGTFQGWADLLAFDKDDTITNNQGLFVTALMCAQAMGIEPHVPVPQALKNYQDLYNPGLAAYPLSLKRNQILAVDPLMGDLLAQVYLGKALLPDAHVLAHFETLKQKAKTAFGFKVFSAADGGYLALDQYGTKTAKSAMSGDQTQNGNYQCGGSWYLYDMLMLMDAHLHGAKDAEDLMIWRTTLEFAAGGTTHEYINTVTGKPAKPNMGWNAAVYGLWSEIIRQGKAGDRFFKAIDALRNP
ncbi:MAG: hypothetical protein WCJ14_12725 [Verrucomicrobiota bacterium]